MFSMSTLPPLPLHYHHHRHVRHHGHHQQQELAKNSPSENRAKEDETKELANRAEELEAEAEEQRKIGATKDAVRKTSTQV